MKVLTAAEMREVDRLTTERIGISTLQLMETAGTRAAEGFREAIRGSVLGKPVVAVLCGKGNNGGDGFVVARHLRNDSESLQVFLFARPEDLSGDVAANYRRWRALGGETISIPDDSAWQSAWPQVARADVIVDAIFGTGFRGSATGAVARAIADVNTLSRDGTVANPSLILAVDTPTGLPSDGQAAEGPVLRAHHTVTFTAPKLGQLTSQDSAAAGTLKVVNIGSPDSLVEEVGQGTLRWLDSGEFASLPLVRQTDGHKGLYGHVLIVAGAVGKSGAAVMSGYAALRAGAGLVTIATPDSVLPIVAAAHPEYMTEPLDSTDAGTATRGSNPNGVLARIEKGKACLAMGPGLGEHPETQAFIRSLVRQSELPIILDADGLNAFAGAGDALRDRKSKFLAVTPHPGEMARLLGLSTQAVQQDRVKMAREAAKRWNAHVVLKGARTVLASPDGHTFVNTTGNAGLAKGGSGDVLTGVLAALTGQFKTDDWLRTLGLGVYLHGAAADLAVESTDPSGLLASEVAATVPRARQKLLRDLRTHA